MVRSFGSYIFIWESVHSSDTDTLNNSIFYLISLSAEATKLQEKLTKLERQSRVRDAMIEISSEISVKKRQSASISVDMEQTNVAENKSSLVTPSISPLYTGDETL